MQSEPGAALAFLSSGDLVADRRYEYAMALAARGERDAAIDLLAQAVALAPHFAGGWFALGDLLTQAGERGRAIAAFERARAADPEDRAGGEALRPAAGRADPLDGKNEIVFSITFRLAGEKGKKVADFQPIIDVLRTRLRDHAGREIDSDEVRDKRPNGFARKAGAAAEIERGAGLRLARLGAANPGEGMPRAYVRTLFDQYALGFDCALARLAYCGPDLLRAAGSR